MANSTETDTIPKASIQKSLVEIKAEKYAQFSLPYPEQSVISKYFTESAHQEYHQTYKKLLHQADLLSGGKKELLETVIATKYDWLLAIAIITPLVSVGYLTIFLIMQPEGMRQFIAMLKLEPVSVTKSRHRPSPSKDLKESIDENKECTRSTDNSNHTFSRADNFSTISNTTLLVSQTLIGYGDVHSYSEQDDEMLLSSLDRIVIDIQRNSDHNTTMSEVDNVGRKSGHANDLEMGPSAAFKFNDLSIDHNPTATTNPILEN